MENRLFKFPALLLGCLFTLNLTAQPPCVANLENGVAEICQPLGASKTFSNSIASGGIIDWLSSGDGAFDNNTLQNPTYTPGPGDIANGYVFIYLDVYKDDSIAPCSALPATTLIFPTLKAVATPAAQSLCSGTAMAPIILTGTLLGKTYTWTRNNTGLVTGIGSSGSGNIVGTLTNTTTAPVTVTFTIVPTGTCANTPITATIVVNPRPAAVAAPASQTICSDAALTAINLTGTPTGTTYNWTRSNPDSLTGIPTVGSGNISGTLTNNYALPLTTVFTITPTANGCSGTPVTSSVVVNPKFSATATPLSQTICSGATITSILPSGGLTGTVYNWTRDNAVSVTGIAASGSGSITGALTNTSSSPVTVTFNIVPTLNGCAGTIVIATVLVNPLPNVVATPLSQAACSGATISTVALTSGVAGTTFNWTRDNPVTVSGIATSGTGNISGALVNNGTTPVTVNFSIVASANGCTAAPQTATVLLNPPATMSATPLTQTICSGSGITPLNFSSSSGTTTFTWTRDNTLLVTGIAASGSGNVSGALVNTGSAPVNVTFTITPVNNGCTGIPMTATVLVNPVPNVLATPSSQAICSGSTIAPIVLTGAVTGATYNWTRDNSALVTGLPASGTGSISGVLTNTTAASLTVTFTITPVANGCTGTPVTATVQVNPGAGVLATPSLQTICSAGTITPIQFSGGAVGTTYNWTRNNTATATGIAASGSGTISGALTNTTTAPVTVTFTITPNPNTCGNATITATVVVNPRPNAVATPSLQSICSGSAISPIAWTGGVAGTSFTWTRNYTASAPGIAASGTGNISGTLTNVTAVAVTVVFTVTPTANGCAGPTNIGRVVVNLAPNAAATPASQSVCSGANLTPIVLSSSTTGTNFNWTRNNTDLVTGIASSGTGNISGSLTNMTTAPIPVTFTITPVGPSCSGVPITAVITVQPKTGSTISGSQSVCAGVTPSNISINFTGTAPWNFTYTDGTTPVTITGNFANPYTFVPPAANATYTVSSLSDAACTSQLIDRTGSAVVTLPNYLISAAAGVGGAISPGGNTPVNCGNTQAYTISPNAGYIIQDVLVDGVSQGTIGAYSFSNVTAMHTISASFTASTGCTPPSINALATNLLCANTNTGAIDITTIGGTGPFNCTWSGPNGFTSSAEDISGLAAGSYTAVIVGAGGCSANTTVVITQPSAITATASAGTIICNGGTTQLTVSASGGTGAYQYSLNGGSFQVANSFTVNAAGSPYTVTVRDANLCTVNSNVVAVTQPLAITGTATAGAITCNGGTTQLNVTASGGTGAYQYRLNAGAFQSGNSFTVNAADSPYTVTVRDANLCTGTTNTVTLTQPLAITATATAGTIPCGGTTTQLTVTASGGTGAYQYRLNTGAFQSSNSFTVNAAGSPYTVTVRDANLCTGATNTVTVTQPGGSSAPAQPTGVTGKVNGLCGGGNFTYSVQAVAGATGYTWVAPAGCTIASGQGTAQISLSVPSNFTGSGTLGVSATNLCRAGPQFSLTLSAILSYPASSITGPSIVANFQSNVQYSLPNVAGATYTWSVPSQARISSGQGTSSIIVRFGTRDGNISVVVKNACGSAPSVSKAVTVGASREASPSQPLITNAGTLTNITEPSSLTVYPNPAGNIASVAFQAPRAGMKFELVVTNDLGQSLFTQPGLTVAGTNVQQIEVGKFRQGIYLVRLTTAGNTLTKKLVKGK